MKGAEKLRSMRILVDLNRCQGYGQCVFLAPERVRAARRGGPHVRPGSRRGAATRRWSARRRRARCRPFASITRTREHEQQTNGAFSTSGHVVIVGASLAGLRAAEALRKGGFQGRLTLVGDEPYEPYDRPPLSKQVLSGRAGPGSTALPQNAGLDAEWRLGTAAAGLDLAGKRVRLADGEEIGYDRLLIATGTRARPGPTRRKPRWTA